MILGGLNNEAREYLCLNSRGSEATNTITRAELAGIGLLMSQEHNEFIAIDSQASICLIARYMNPRSIYEPLQLYYI